MSDFQKALWDLGLTEEDLNATLSAQVQTYGLAEYDFLEVAYVGHSDIHNRGAFSVRSQARGSRFFPVRLGKQVTVIGAYVNHSNTPNCQLVHYRNGDQYLEALDWIYPGEEITHDYREAIAAEEPRDVEG